MPLFLPPPNLLTEWARLLLKSFADAGVRDVVISPGSRSTPFVVAAVREPRLRCHTIIDERAAGFFALGKARVDETPALLLCTSGTAAAHYLPAIIEANLAFVPLIVMTADRPTELADCAAPQTIDQIKLFGQNVRAFFDLGMPDPSELSLRALRRMAFQATFMATSPLPGAVHLNARARKPLEPVVCDDDDDDELSKRARQVGAQSIHIVPPSAGGAMNTVSTQEIARVCQTKERGIIICGPAPLAQIHDREAIHDLARATGFPIAAEATSQLRFARVPDSQKQGAVIVLDMLEPILRSPRFRERHGVPDVVIQIGRPPTSTGWERLLGSVATKIVLARFGWNDPDSSATHLVFGDIGENAKSIAASVRSSRPSKSSSTWARELEAKNAKVRSLATQPAGIVTEGQIANVVVEEAPRGSRLMLGNSLAVRLVDTFARAAANEDLGVLSQRGASGIDGLVAGAAGAASASARSSPAVTLLLGDVSLLHDLTSLGIARETARAARVPIVVVVIQNHGGRIFEQLPLVTATGTGVIEQEILDRTITPHAYDFAHAAAMFGVNYVRIDSDAKGAADTLRSALRCAYRGGESEEERCTLLEIVVPPHGAATEQRELAASVEQI